MLDFNSNSGNSIPVKTHRSVGRWLWLLPLLLVIGVLWWWFAGNICNLPIHYRIGHYDERFGLTQQELLSAMREAEKIWEDASGRELLEYSIDGRDGVAVNLVYDQRQMATQELEQLRTEKDSLESELDVINNQYQELHSIFNRQTKVITEMKTDYDERLRLFELTVQSWNERGGAPKDVLNELKSEQDSLTAYIAELNDLITEHNQLAERLNQLAGEGQERVSGYNSEVDYFNENFVTGEDDEQGIYGSGTINVYQFDSQEDLVLLLVHEFGHALGLGHDQDPKSVMFPRKNDQQLETGGAFIPTEILVSLVNRCNLKPYSGHD